MTERTRGLEFKVSDVSNVKVLECIGEIDTDTYQKFDKQLFSLIQSESRYVVLVLEKAPVINSMGVGVVVRAHKRLKELGGGLVLLSPSAGIRQVLYTLMLEKKLSICTSMEEAVRSLTETPIPLPPVGH